MSRLTLFRFGYRMATRGGIGSVSAPPQATIPTARRRRRSEHRRLLSRGHIGDGLSLVQVDFGRLGMLTDAADGRRRVVHGLIFTAVYSRHMFVWPTYRQTLNDVIAGFEAAWGFFGGVFAVVIPDNMKAIVDRADATDPKLNDAFREYAQARGFAVDPARVRSPRDKPGSSAVSPMCGRISLPEKTSGISTTAGHAPSAGVGRWPGCGCTAPPDSAPPKCSPPTSYPSSNRRQMRCSTSRHGPIPRSPRTGTCRSPRPSTAFPVNWWAAGWTPASTPTR